MSWVDRLPIYVVAIISAPRTPQTVAEGYEERVIRRFGASEVILHDRQPRFMSFFVRAIHKISGKKQRDTMVYLL